MKHYLKTRHITAASVESGWRRLRRFLRDGGGNALIVFGLAMPVVAGTAGMAVDYSVWTSQRAHLRAAADAAAIAAAKELASPHGTASTVQSVAETVAQANLQGAIGDGAISIVAAVMERNSGVEVVVTQPGETYFSELLLQSPPVIEVRAAAKSVGQTVCVIGLDPSQQGTVHLESNARLTAENCAVYSNSTNATGMRSKKDALLKSQFACSAGGIGGSRANFDPYPLTDCPPIEDPLLSRPAPPIGSCAGFDLEIDKGERTLYPGTYCGGLKINGNARVTFSPGIYVIKDGRFQVKGNATVSGDYVGFYFIGDDADLVFEKNTTISLGAPKDGPMAGILFYQDRGAPELVKFSIESNNARKLLGTIYFPNGRLVVKAKAPVADRSAYTVIVARFLELYEGPNLVINTRFADTDVPVPNNVGPILSTQLIK